MSQHEHLPNPERSPTEDSTAKILLIDDDENITRIVSKFLRKHGFDVTVTNSGEAGVRVASELIPDLVVCDLAMSGIGGYEVLACLRQDSRLADVPVVFLTGQSEPEQIREGMSLGADDYLTKPVDSDDLLRAIKIRLARARARREQHEKQMERALQTFAGIVHDLRDPLFVVFGYTDLLRQDGPPPASSEQRAGEILDRMQQAIGRMQTIVSETLFLAKSKMQRLPFDPAEFDLRVLCEQVIADQEQDSRLRFECSAKECVMVGDPVRLRQAIENLLGNALKYSDKAVVLALSKRPSGFLIEVRDQGIGIPPADKARVFDPFFRASNTAGKPGHGLGLSVVKTCIEQQGGSVTFASEAGKGTTFSIEVPGSPPAESKRSAGAATDLITRQRAPMAESERVSSPSDATPAGSRGSRKARAESDGAESKLAPLTGVIVDDDPLVRDVLRDLLAGLGEISVVGEAGSVAQARELIGQRNPDVVFLDINLPDAKGFDLLPDLAPGTSVVFVSSAEEYALTAFDSNAVDYLLKPVSRERLQKTLSRLRERAASKPAATAGASLGLDDTFLVKTMAEKKLIKVREVKSIIAYGEYSWVYWNKGKGALLRKALKQWETELPDSQFVRVHRNAIINLAFMERLEKTSSGRLLVHLRETADPIAVSLRLAPALNRKLKAFKR